MQLKFTEEDFQTEGELPQSKDYVIFRSNDPDQAVGLHGILYSLEAVGVKFIEYKKNGWYFFKITAPLARDYFLIGELFCLYKTLGGLK